MVERPIKRSERQTLASPGDVVEEVLGTEPSAKILKTLLTSPRKKGHNAPIPRKDKTKKRSNQQDLSVQGKSRCVVPKPTKLAAIKETLEATTEEESTSRVKRRLRDNSRRRHFASMV